MVFTGADLIQNAAAGSLAVGVGMVLVLLSRVGTGRRPSASFSD